MPNDFEEITSNCSDKLNCSNLEQTLNFTDNVYYYKSPSEMLTPWAINEYFSFIMVTYALTFLVGVIGNAVVIFLLLSDKKSATYVFLVSLSIADLLILTICAPLDVAHYFMVQWDKEGVVCKLAAYAESVSAFASVLNLLAVTGERFVVIVYPIRARSLCTMSNCKRIVAAVWTTSLVMSLPVIFTMGVKKYTFTNYIQYISFFHCKESSDAWGLLVAVYRFTLLFALPLIIMITTYTLVSIELWSSTRAMEEMTNSEINCEDPNDHELGDRVRESHAANKAARKQVIKMLIFVVLLFLTCYGPRLLMEILFKCCLDVFDHNPTKIFFYLLPFVHSCLNPIVYGIMSSNFREILFRNRQQPPQ